MRLKLKWSTCALLCSSLLLSTLTFAKDGRDFAGFFAISDVNDLGDRVQLTLTLQLFNYSAADVKNAVVSLQALGPGMTSRGSYPTVKLLPNLRDVRLSKQLTVPHNEYEHWQKGNQPNVMIAFKAPSGQLMRRTVELVRRPALPTN